MAKKSGVTPIRKQYLDIKSQYPDAILFFRLGDFYETFDEDAEIAARVLDIVLTSRNVAKGTRIPMAGIPHHALENYMARLIEKGYHPDFGARPLRRAIEHQLEDPLSEELLKGNFEEKNHIVVEVDADEEKLRFTPSMRTPAPAV